ncbi:peptide/nickel transport system ATP-binding protein [Jatrophihabitans endophyticus]|uniref:Peptide/nickel transport system ATP-binding protein n=1 Tax=Jatrophihabitans endophyticus TaxID=1206085 RepID=A0A1M5PH75_9ACTN|nr:ABC transporter ATP-binding protein [Jatrophihabitans endophyticus]SHH01174.1 peptide/nickel transport system ATP-binding protein [Jatrophihabitans endophyticus]
MTSLLEVEDLSVSLPTKRGHRTAVDSVSFALDRGAILGLAGESGSGKTMTAMSVLGLLPHGARTSGSVRLDGTELLTLSQRRLRDVRGRRVALISQDPATSLHPMLTVGTQLTEHMRHHLGLDTQQARERALELLATVRIPDPQRAFAAHPGVFSGGMRQRIAIASALACEPDVLLADEPTTALDVTVQAGILRLLDRLRRERGLAVLVITHDLGVLSAIADEVCVMYGGRIVERGGRAAVLGGPGHPYTRALLDALPHPGVVGAAGPPALRPIPGSPPALGEVPVACAFEPRCSRRVASCSEHRPVLVRTDGATDPHEVACLVTAPAGGHD